MNPIDNNDTNRLGQEYNEAVYASVQAALAVAATRKDFEVIVAQCESIAGYRDADDIARDARQKMETLREQPDLDKGIRGRAALAAAGQDSLARLKELLRKGKAEAVKKACEARLSLRIFMLQRKCTTAFAELGKELYEQGESLLAEGHYRRKIEALRSLHAEIDQCRQERKALRG